MDRYTIPEISKILNMPRSTIIYHIREKKWLRADKMLPKQIMFRKINKKDY